MKKKMNTSINQEFGQYCDDYISQGSNIDEVRNYLNFASIAWNLSLYPQEMIDEQVKLISDEYARLNPNLMDSSKLQHDLKLLIDKKIHMYPDIKRTITKIEINETDNDYKISAESEEFKMEK
jgi:hypothetical protein